MAGRNLTEAYRNYIKPLQAALNCITAARLTLRKGDELILNKPFSVVLNDMDAVRLKGITPIDFTAGQIVRIIKTDDVDRGPYKVSTVRYFYTFWTTGDQPEEILSFQWTPEETGPGVVPFPHLHIGPAIISGQNVVRSKDLHKAHIPTGRVSIEAIVRLAITELGTTPQKRRWERILNQSELAFTEWKTR